MALPYHPGQIVLAPVIDPQDRNLKERPLVVVGCNETLVAVIAVTSQLAEIPAADRVDLPHSNDPLHPCYTGLDRPSAAHCDWQEVVNVSDVRRVTGYASREHLLLITARVRELRAIRQEEARKAAPAEKPPPQGG
jgi:hypothetical protein